MLRNYIIIAIRNIWKHRAFSFINITGLSLGIAAALLILQYVRFEESYDKFHPDWERIFRVSTVNLQNGEMTYKDAMSFNQVGPTLKENLSEVTSFARAFKIFEGISIRKENYLYRETGALVVDPSFLELFNYPLIKGDPESALEDPYSVILTKDIADKLFPQTDPVGQSIEIPEGQFEGLYKITGVVKDTPSNTHMGFTMLISYETMWRSGFEPNWTNFVDYTFIKLTEGTDPVQFQEKILPMSREYIGENTTLVFWLQPLADIHLHSDFSYEAEVNGNALSVKFLLIIAIMIVIIAWVNYINLSTAKSMDRAREVGIRKIIGANKRSLISQFFTESVVINLLSVILAIIIVYLSFPLFKELTGIKLPDFVSDDYFWMITGLLFAAGVITSGIYPALVQSSFRAMSVIKGKFSGSGKGFILRKFLVIAQFSVSIFFIASTLLVYKQIEHMRNSELGMNLDKVMVIREGNMIMSGDSLSDERFLRFRNTANTIAGVEKISTSASIPAGGTSNIGSMSGGIWWDQHITTDQYTYYFSTIDESFIPAYRIELIAGNNFHASLPEDSIQHTIINQTALRKLGFPEAESAIGELLVLGEEHRPRFRIVGVIQDFHRQSLKYPVEPTLYAYNHYENGTYYSIKLNTTDFQSTLQHVKSIWTDLFPNTPFEYFFADERFNNQYQADMKFGNVVSIFTILAIIIACLGLYGLSYLMLKNKTKEIGVRKVLGSTSEGIMILISKDFFRLIFISYIVGIPLIYYVMNHWLDNYATRIEIPIWILVVSGIAVLGIVLLTISYQTFRTSRINPAESLRYE